MASLHSQIINNQCQNSFQKINITNLLKARLQPSHYNKKSSSSHEKYINQIVSSSKNFQLNKNHSSKSKEFLFKLKAQNIKDKLTFKQLIMNTEIGERFVDKCSIKSQKPKRHSIFSKQQRQNDALQAMPLKIKQFISKQPLQTKNGVEKLFNILHSLKNDINLN